MAVEELGAPPIALPRSGRHVRGDASRRFARGLSRVLAAERPSVWEFGVVVAGLFVLGRYPVLFVRSRLAHAFDDPIVGVWQDDPIVLTTLLVATAAMVLLAVWFARAGAIIGQPALLAVVVIVWLSVAWSVEPSASFRRAILFIGATVTGWYIGDRFSLRAQVASVAIAAALGAVLSAIAFGVWPSVALATNRIHGEWSGIYVNRNHFGLVLSYGILATAILFMSRRRWRIPLFAVLGAEILMLWGTGSRTGPIALAVAASVVALVALVRPWGVRMLKGWAGALACTGVIVIVGGFVQWYWTTILDVLGRDVALTGRAKLWDVTRWFARLRPWEGWGFEAVWVHPRPALQAIGVLGTYPYTAHNGYYDFLLGTGRIGLGLLLLFLVILAWRAFRYAWTRTDALSLWPLALVTFVVVVNFSESLFVSAETLWVLTVATAMTVAGAERRRRQAST